MNLILALAAVLTQEDTTVQQQLQKRVQTDTQQTVRRIETMLRVILYHRLDSAQEKRVFEDVAATLSRLSKDDMNEVIERLKSAAKATDDQKSSAEIEQAYVHHRAILESLNRVLSQYDAVRDLEQAAERMETAAVAELELSLETWEFLRDAARVLAFATDVNVEKAKAEAEKTKSNEKTEEQRRQETFERQGREERTRLARSIPVRAGRLADDQADIHTRLKDLMGDLGALRDRLPADQRDRLQGAEALAAERGLPRALDDAAKKLRDKSSLDQTMAPWKATEVRQRKAAADLRELARALRAPAQDLEALRDARRQVGHEIEREEALKAEAAVKPHPNPRFADDRARQLANQQARIEFDVQDTRALLLPLAPAVASKVEEAGMKMQEARQALRDWAPAARPLNEAVARLKEAAQELDQLIAEAEKAKADPLAALQKAKEDLEKLIQDQKDTKKDTEKAQANELPQIAPQQQDLAARTQDLKQQMPPDQEKIQPALDKAQGAMENAKESLQAKKQPDAAQMQEQAIRALEEARQAVDEAIAAIQQQQNESLTNAAQQIAKAIEQAELAQEQAQQAIPPGNSPPSLAEMQAQLAQQAHQQNQPAAEPAKAAAHALEQGNLPQAIEEQKKALAQLHEAAKHPPGPPEAAPPAKPEAAPPGPPTPAELARQQQQLLEMTQALLNSQQANMEAQAATAQAQVLAPQAVQPQLGQAQQHLGQAAQALAQGLPMPAAPAQAQARAELHAALAQLNAQLAALGLPQVHPGEAAAAQATGQQPGLEPGQALSPMPGQTPGQAPAPGQAPGQGPPVPGVSMDPTLKPAEDENRGRALGNRLPGGPPINGAAQLLDVKGGESFLLLPPRQRELIRQSLSEGLPPEYAARIQQYYINLARGRAATSPALSERKK